MRKHALSLFTKAPQPGMTKTHLTRKYGGSLSDQEAADFYRATMFDVATAAFRALELCRKKATGENKMDKYDFCVSCTPETEKPELEKIFQEEYPNVDNIRYIVDKGQNFDEHFNDHYQQLFKQGYHSVVCVGGDLPTISPDFICRAFQWLDYLWKESEKGAIVIAPCQAAGVSLVGLTADTPMDFTGVFYNMQGMPALEAIIKIAAERQIPVSVLETQADVDTMEDMGHTIALINALKYASHFIPDNSVPERTLAWINMMGLVVNTPPNKEYDSRKDIDGQD